MYPIILDVTRLTLALIGKGAPAEKRFKQLKEAGATKIMRFQTMPSETELQQVDIVFVVGFDEAASQAIASAAKKAGKLVNVEDKTLLCDFHIPAIVRRGDLLFTISTAGKSPALARTIRKQLEAQFGEEWAERLELVAAKRKEWQAAGLGFEEVMERSDAMIMDLTSNI